MNDGSNGGAVLVRVEVEPSAEDFVEVSMLPFRGRRRRTTVLLLIDGAAVCAMTWFEVGRDLWGWVLGGILVYAGVRSAGASRALLRKFYREHPHMAAHSTITIREDGVLVEDGPVDMLYRWPAFSHVDETPRLFLLQRGAGFAAVYIPKRCLGGEAGVAACRAALVERIGRTAARGERAGFEVALRDGPAVADGTDRGR